MPNFGVGIALHKANLFYILISLLMLQACAKSEFGQQLAKSFDQEISSESLSNAKEIDQNIKKKVNKPPKKKDLRPLDYSDKINVKPQRKRRKKTFVPHPYRITIQLSGADPSAPAEAVTEALRMSGVTFEVERIERIDIKNSIGGKKLEFRSQP